MRELDANEIALVDGGVAPLVVAAVVIGVLGIAAIGVAAYAAYNDCSASVEVGKDGVKLELDCKKPEST